MSSTQWNGRSDSEFVERQTLQPVTLSIISSFLSSSHCISHRTTSRRQWRNVDE